MSSFHLCQIVEWYKKCDRSSLCSIVQWNQTTDCCARNEISPCVDFRRAHSDVLYSTYHSRGEEFIICYIHVHIVADGVPIDNRSTVTLNVIIFIRIHVCENSIHKNTATVNCYYTSL